MTGSNGGSREGSVLSMVGPDGAFTKGECDYPLGQLTGFTFLPRAAAATNVHNTATSASFSSRDRIGRAPAPEPALRHSMDRCGHVAAPAPGGNP